MTGDILQEHRGPSILFSVAAFSQLQFIADCLPQEHLACKAQTQAPPARPQQVLGTVMANRLAFVEGPNKSDGDLRGWLG